MRAILAAFAALGLMALSAEAQPQPNRFVEVRGETWGYVQREGAPVTFPETGGGPGMGIRLGVDITILTRNGRPVTEADRLDAWYAAAQACQNTRRRFEVNARGILLRRGGIRYPGNCS